MKPLHLQLWLATQRWRVAVWPGYLVAVVAPLLSTAVRLALGDALIGYPFITFFPAILLTALVGGRGAAALATLLSAFLASSYAVDAGGNLLPQSASAWIGIAFFLIVCTIIIALVHWLYDALDQLSVLNSNLEQRVEARTRQLTQANADLIAEAKAREAAEAQLRHSQKDAGDRPVDGRHSPRLQQYACHHYRRARHGQAAYGEGGHGYREISSRRHGWRTSCCDSDAKIAVILSSGAFESGYHRHQWSDQGHGGAFAAYLGRDHPARVRFRAVVSGPRTSTLENSKTPSSI